MNTLPFVKTYSARFSLQCPALTLAPGELCCVIGANGSGKSTLAKVLSGVSAPDGGTAVFDGPCAVGYLPQHPYVFRMSALQNMTLPLRDAARAAELMREVHIDLLARQRATKLSGGETARLSLARVLMRRHDVLILDEPTAAADIESVFHMERLLLRYREETGCAVLLVTHSLQQARRLADTALFLHQGHLLERGPARKVLYAPDSAPARQFLALYGASESETR